MRASEVLQSCLAGALEPMHALRERVSFKALEALTAGWQLTLIDLACRRPDAKANARTAQGAGSIVERPPPAHRVLVTARGDGALVIAWPRSLMVIAWSDLKAEKNLVPAARSGSVGGRTLTCWTGSTGRE